MAQRASRNNHIALCCSVALLVTGFVTTVDAFRSVALLHSETFTGGKHRASHSASFVLLRSAFLQSSSNSSQSFRVFAVTRITHNVTPIIGVTP